jgi:O-methyltransferase
MPIAKNRTTMFNAFLTKIVRKFYRPGRDEIVGYVDGFLQSNHSSDLRAEMFSELLDRFVAANPVPSQVATMFNDFLTKIAYQSYRPGRDEIVGYLDGFLQSNHSYDLRAEIFSDLLDRFVAANPVPSQVATMFDDFLTKVVRPKHNTMFWGDRMLSLDKAAAFLTDPDFAKAYAAVRGNHIYDAYDSPHTVAWRLNTLVWAARSAVHVEGDFVECGVFKGDMSWTILSILGDALSDRTFYLYDSFEGLLPSDDVYPGHEGFIEFANKIYGDPKIYTSVVHRFANYPNVKVIKGFLPDALTQGSPDRIAFLHLDLNAAMPEVAVMEAFFDRVSPGGMIVYDDYGWHVCEQQRLAADMFAASRNHKILELPTGQGLIVKH